MPPTRASPTSSGRSAARQAPPTPRTPDVEDSFEPVTRSTPIHIDTLNRRAEKLRRDKADLRAEAHSLESALVNASVAGEIALAAERERAANDLRAAEFSHAQHIAEAQEALNRVQLQMEGVKEAARSDQAHGAAELERRLDEQSAKLHAENGSASDQIVEQLRSEYETRLFESMSKAERLTVEKEQAMQALAEKDATITTLREELQERRDAMARLHAACSRSCNVAAASAFASTLPDSMLMRLAQPAVSWRPPPSPQPTRAPRDVLREPPLPPPPLETPLETPPPPLETPEPRPAAAFIGAAAGARTDIRPRPLRDLMTPNPADEVGVDGGMAAAAPPGTGPACGSTASAREVQRAAADAEAELSMRLGLAKAEKALRGAARRETELREEHAKECEAYEAELRVARACERVLRAELRPLELELETHAGVYIVLQRTLAQLAEAEARARAERQSAEEGAAATRRAEQRAEESRVECEEALAQAFSDREARERAEASSAAAARRAEREVEAAEASKAAAMASADSVVASTHGSAAALGEAVDALHRWVDGIMRHDASSAASTIEAVQAIVKGAAMAPSLRGAHASLEALHARLQYVCEEVVRLRATAASRADELDRKTQELMAAQDRGIQQRQRSDALEGAVRQAEEAARVGRAEAEAARAKAEASERKATEAEARAALVRTGLEERRQLVNAVAVQLSDAMRRSGCVGCDAPMLLDSSCATWEFDRLALGLSSLASHVSFYWAADQRKADDLRGQLELARERLREKEDSLSRAAAIATGMKQYTTGLGGGPGGGVGTRAIPGRGAYAYAHAHRKRGVSMTWEGRLTPTGISDILSPLGPPPGKDFIAYDSSGAAADLSRTDHGTGACDSASPRGTSRAEPSEQSASGAGEIA